MAEGGKKEDTASLYSNPVFKKISLKNGEINKLNYVELRKLAENINMCGEGSVDILKKRLKSYYRNLYLRKAAMMLPKKPYTYYIIIDFEATCEDKDSPKTDYPHEIIEFPAVAVNCETLTVETVFHEYVRPVVNKTLTDYCVALTGISQSVVDSADPFPLVFGRFIDWMNHNRLIGCSAIVTDGPWDMARFLYTQVKLSKLPYPKFAKQWVNIKKTFANFYNQRKPKLDEMLEKLNFEFEGRRHSGIDDSYNIAKVLIQLLKDGAVVYVNERIDLSTFQSHAHRPISEIVRPVNGNNFDGHTYNESKLPSERSEVGSWVQTVNGDQHTEGPKQNEDLILSKEDLILSLEQSTAAFSELCLNASRVDGS